MEVGPAVGYREAGTVAPGAATAAEAREEGFLQRLRVASARPEAAGEDGLREAAADFEALFLARVFETLRRTVPRSGFLGGGPGEEVFTSLLDGEVASLAARTAGVGLADLLVEQLRDQVAAGQGARKAGTLRNRPPSASGGGGWADGGVPGAGGGAAAGSLRAPVAGPLTSAYGSRRDPFTHEERFHGGLDLLASGGDPVRAAAAGTVSFVGELRGYGKVVVVDHGGGLETLYGHASALTARRGDRVEAGDVVALAGRSGRATGVHVHFEVRRYGERVDPAPFLDRDGGTEALTAR